ncbi:MAG: 50S ribosomal protein L35 [Armatimonadetes bacterium]|nr:50S ribosomal protein L35 [Armatimonadota bacterium]
MPKIKTRRSLAKRIKTTSSGKIKRMRTFSGCHHILEKKSPKRKRNFRKPAFASHSDEKKIKQLAPYV